METIYSKIIWKELGYTPETYQIHKEDYKKTNKLILDWIKTSDFDKVEKTLFDLSFIHSVTYEDYYDGPFYGFNQRDDDKRVDGPDLMIHDTYMFPTILHMCAKTKVSPSELRFIAKILEIYYKRVPKDRKEACTWRDNKRGDKL